MFYNITILNEGKGTEKMAILAVKIDDLATLRMNEFFDYAGHCWALSRNRDKDSAMGAELEDFYEGTVRSSQMEEIPVVFIHDHQIIGWYVKAMVYRYIRHPALFLEGNVCADIRDVRLLKNAEDFEGIVFGKDKNYVVIETDDTRYMGLQSLIDENRGPFEPVDYARVPTDPRVKNAGRLPLKTGHKTTSKDRVNHILAICETLALDIMEDRCFGIGTVKSLGGLALEATRYDTGNVNAWYYLAMANYQLGFVRKGLKAIDRAIRLEPDADDLLVMKGNLMVSNGWLEEALRCYESAYEINPEDSYYVMAGRACACMGNPMAADQYYRKVKNRDVLKAFGISPGKKKLL